MFGGKPYPYSLLARLHGLPYTEALIEPRGGELGEGRGVGYTLGVIGVKNVDPCGVLSW